MGNKWDVHVALCFESEKRPRVDEIEEYLRERGIEPASIRAISSEPLNLPEEWVAINQLNKP